MTAGEVLMERGRKEGMVKVLLKLLRARFGPLPAEAVANVERADLEVLDAWAERVLTARTLADVFAA